MVEGLVIPRRAVPIVSLVFCACLPSNDERPTTAQDTPRPHQVEARSEPIRPIMAEPVGAPELVQLGGRLFHDPRLSKDGTIACASCHAIADGGDDGRPLAVGINGAVGDLNSPTVLNSGLNLAQFWDGRADNLEAQAVGPLFAAKEMGGDIDHLLSFLRDDSYYSTAFARAFDDGVTLSNVQRAIAAFERTLTTPHSRFDRWLLGDESALTETELAGYQLFKDVGCIACHQGKNVGGNMFQRFGVLRNYLTERGKVSKRDLGRFNVTQREEDRFVFKVPALRVAALTAPYLHDGSVATLAQAVAIMGEYQLGRTLNDAQVAQIVAFLKTLPGDVPDASRYTKWVREQTGRMAARGNL